MASFEAKKGRKCWEWQKKKKFIVPIHSNPTRNREFQKNSKKMQKIRKQHSGFISSQNRTGQAESVSKKKKVIVSIHSNPTKNREFQKNSIN